MIKRNLLIQAIVIGICVACNPAIVTEREPTPAIENTLVAVVTQVIDATMLEDDGTPVPTATQFPTPTPAATLDVSQGEILMSVYPEGDIRWVNADGSNGQILLDEAIAFELNDNRHATWLPDGSGISYTIDDFTQVEIWVMDNQGDNHQFLLGGVASNSSHCWSPDGKKVAYVSTQFKIQIYDLVHQTLTPLTDGSLGMEENPDWSPDGSRIVFSAIEGGNQDIFIINTDGTGLDRVTNHLAIDASPDWSPDGMKIAFSSTRDGDRIEDIFVIDLSQGMEEDGNNPIQLTFGDTFDIDPDWNPDGSIIVYASLSQGAHHATLFLVDANGISRFQLTRENIYHSPQWRP